MTLRNALMLCLLAIVVTACQMEPSRVQYIRVTPTLYSYTKDFQARANADLGSLPACPRNVVKAGCSAARTLVDDYGVNRNQIRALGGK